MTCFLVRAAGEIIGWSHLETGDPPMGVASGWFFPNEAYRRDEHASSDLLAVTREDGREVGPSLGVDITDLGPDHPDEPLWIDVIGLDSELYRELFPRQHDAYWKSAE
jgi:hypothetical protein